VRKSEGAVTANLEAELSDEQSRAIAARVREELARRRSSRQRLADEARISISTLEKALAGRRPFTLATLIRLEEALGVPLRSADSATAQAPESLGAYSRAAVAWLEGDYLTLRPSFEEPNAVFAYRTSIAWEAAASSLVFHEAERLDSSFTQSGQVSLPNQSGHIYLTTNHKGQFRLITLGRPTIRGEMFGLLSTLHSGAGGHLTPIAAPIALLPTKGRTQTKLGRVSPGDEDYDAYRRAVDQVVQQTFVRILGVGSAG
jgi:transcriptional regulator with XRE-family HTH domain